MQIYYGPSSFPFSKCALKYKASTRWSRLKRETARGEAIVSILPFKANLMRTLYRLNAHGQPFARIIKSKLRDCRLIEEEKQSKTQKLDLRKDALNTTGRTMDLKFRRRTMEVALPEDPRSSTTNIKMSRVVTIRRFLYPTRPWHIR